MRTLSSAVPDWQCNYVREIYIEATCTPSRLDGNFLERGVSQLLFQKSGRNNQRHEEQPTLHGPVVPTYSYWVSDPLI